MCWGDFGNGEVNCIDDDGTNPRNIVTLLFSVPIKVEIDEVNQKVYWSETNFFVSDVIRRANLDGTNIEDVITPLPTDPLATFVVDGAGGRIYFARGSQVSADIVSANLDGTAEVVLATGVADVGDLALDLVDGKIYWHEEVSATTKRIVRSNLDGSSPEVVIPAISNPCLLYTSPSPRDKRQSRMPSSA